MDIKDVSAELARTARKERPEVTRRGSASAKTSNVESDRDFFENSGRLGQVRALIDSLVQAPEIRADAVARGKELLASGELDSQEQALAAARGFLAEDGGRLG